MILGSLHLMARPVVLFTVNTGCYAAYFVAQSIDLFLPVLAIVTSLMDKQRTGGNRIE